MNRTIIYKTSSFPSISETFVVNSIVSAIEKGYEVSIIADEKKNLEQSSQPNTISKYNLLEKVKIFPEPQLNEGRRWNAFQILLNPFYAFYFLKYCIAEQSISLSYLFQLKFYRNFRKAKAYHIHFAYNAGEVISLKRIGFLSSKIILTFHGYDAHYLTERPTKGVDIFSINRFVDKITVNSSYLKDLLISKGIEEDLVKVVPVGIDTQYFVRDTTPIVLPFNTVKLISVGRLIPLKGQDLGLKVVRSLIDRGMDVHYTLIGSGKNLQKLKQMTSELSLESNITFLGDRTQVEIKDHLQRSHIFLMTSIADKDGRREAFGVVSLEAQAMGVPVVAFRSGGVPETIEDGKTGIIVPENDVKAMSDAIERLTSKPEVYSGMSKAAQQSLRKNFDISTTAMAYLDLYEN